MADITITCSTCGNTITVSEFVEAEFITCLKCKTPVSTPAREKVPVAASPKLKLVIEKPAPPPPPVVPPPKKKRWAAKAKNSKSVGSYLPKTTPRRRSRKISNFEVKVLPWLVFVLLALVLSWLRFWPGALAADIEPTFISSGVGILFFLHLTIVCLAFTDDAFSGILCLIIPGYSIYYLFTQADQMILRATVGALMIAFGWDFLVAAKDLWDGFYASASHWIATTESMKK